MLYKEQAELVIWYRCVISCRVRISQWRVETQTSSLCNLIFLSSLFSVPWTLFPPKSGTTRGGYMELGVFELLLMSQAVAKSSVASKTRCVVSDKYHRYWRKHRRSKHKIPPFFKLRCVVRNSIDEGLWALCSRMFYGMCSPSSFWILTVSINVYITCWSEVKTLLHPSGKFQWLADMQQGWDRRAYFYPNKI